MWSVWLYTPSGGRKFIDRFNIRNEAEAYRSLFSISSSTPILNFLRLLISTQPHKWTEQSES
jgi:hypothetical protein